MPEFTAGIGFMPAFPATAPEGSRCLKDWSMADRSLPADFVRMVVWWRDLYQRTFFEIGTL